MSKEKEKRGRRKITRPLKSGRGALWMIALVFVASAGLRIASGTGAAIARELTDLSAQDLASGGGVQPQTCQTDEETTALIAALMEREGKIKEDEMLIAQKWKAVELAKAEISENLAALEDAEQRLSATMARAATAAEDDLAKLTAVYEAMKPKEAAALFEAMSPDFAAGFLGRMRSDVAAAIMVGLQPETAYTISVILAGRNANVPSE